MENERNASQQVVEEAREEAVKTAQEAEANWKNQHVENWRLEMLRHPGVPLWAPGSAPGHNASYGQPEPSLTPYLPKEAKAPCGAVVICPGGGFQIKAVHEGRPVAEWLNTLGIAGFVVDYRLVPYLQPVILGDVQRAIRLVRHHASDWNIDPTRVGVLGFSAGGQLTVWASTLFDSGDPDAADPVERQSCRPDVQIPCYPAISSLAQMEGMSEENLGFVRSFMGPDATEVDLRRVSAPDNIREDTPPAFLWGTDDDFLFKHWPPYLNALRDKGVSCAFHLFAKGPHGMGLAEDHPTASRWPGLCGEWLKEQGY